jgi:hypothetical protein
MPMATDDSSASSTYNPSITEIEPRAVEVRPAHDVASVAREISDRDGAGFRTILDQLAALDLSLKLIGSINRLRGWVGELS